jgi:predicted dehydrogenase
MANAADRAGVRHMTAFTYRFVPAMRYLTHLVRRGDLGQPYHYRSCRLQDWGTRNLGWRQVKKLAGTGELGDMLSHRIDFAHLLIGPMRRLVANTRILHPMRGGAPSDLEDWVAVIAEFQNGASGVLESSKLASGRNESWRSLDYVEINGSERSYIFVTGEWNKLQTGKVGGPGLEPIPVPEEFWRSPGSPRDPRVGDPLVTFPALLLARGLAGEADLAAVEVSVAAEVDDAVAFAEASELEPVEDLERYVTSEKAGAR